VKGFDAQLASRKTVLKKIIEDGPINWRTIITNTEPLTGSPKTSQSALDWLLASSYIKRMSRGVYEATERGGKFLHALMEVKT